MSSFYEKAKYFHSLHVRGQPLVLFNIWDVGSAKAVEGAGARALATGSWSVAKANGYEDGERVPLDFASEKLARRLRRSSCHTSSTSAATSSSCRPSRRRMTTSGSLSSWNAPRPTAPREP